jgi:nucleoside diphosphate kinase
MLFSLSSSIVFLFVVHSVLNDVLASFNGVFGVRKIMGVTHSNYGSSCKIRFRFGVGTEVTPYGFC